ncbi:winged helix-turn-helix domain-containing protein [Citricoccus sp. GCM10030269]|uniref:winged helix-turn-helix domain-containing protein n=1 Tax=Citricoccus sp. GCM10030269 TaxID=3273388 RepID=UPI003611AB43
MTDDKSSPQDSPDPVVGKDAMPGVAARAVDAGAMKAFAHPLRMAMYSYLNDRGSATATSMAKHLNESTGQTSYHLRQLEKHGFVEEDTDRGSGRERWWKPVGFAVPTYELSQDESNRPAIQALFRTSLHQRAEALGRWLSVENHADPEWVRASIDSTSTRTMTAKQARALSEELMAVIERHEKALDEAEPAADALPGQTADGEETRRIRLYLSVFPLVIED